MGNIKVTAIPVLQMKSHFKVNLVNNKAEFIFLVFLTAIRLICTFLIVLGNKVDWAKSEHSSPSINTHCWNKMRSKDNNLL